MTKTTAWVIKNRKNEYWDDTYSRFNSKKLFLLSTLFCTEELARAIIECDDTGILKNCHPQKVEIMEIE